MSRSKKARKRQQQSTIDAVSSLKTDFTSVETHLKDLGDCWPRISDFNLQKEFISKKQKAYDSFEALKKKVFLVLETK